MDFKGAIIFDNKNGTHCMAMKALVMNRIYRFKLLYNVAVLSIINQMYI